MSRRFSLVCLIASVVLVSHAAPAFADLVMSLGPGSLAGNVLSYDVSLKYDPPVANYDLVEFGLDVSPSSPALAAANFAAFSFVPNASLFALWVNIKPFGTAIDPGVIQFDDNTVDPKGAGTYLLGTLKVDLTAIGLLPDAANTVSIESTSTQIGAEDPNNPRTFDFFPVTFDPGTRPATAGEGTVPEPASWLTFLLTLAIGAAVYRRR